MNATDSEVLLTAEEVAARLALTCRQMVQLLRAGQIPPPVTYYRDGRPVPLWPSSAIAAFVEGLPVGAPPARRPRPPEPVEDVPTGPTHALPGSEEKLRVLVARAARRMSLFHSENRTSYRRRTPS